jgi:hypothetical protein
LGDLCAAVDGDCQVHAEERVAWVGHRIDVPPEPAGRPPGVPVEALERQHHVVVAEPEPARDPVGVQAGRVDHVPDLPGAVGGRHPTWLRAGHPSSEAHLTAAAADPAGEGDQHPDR